MKYRIPMMIMDQEPGSFMGGGAGGAGNGGQAGREPGANAGGNAGDPGAGQGGDPGAGTGGPGNAGGDPTYQYPKGLDTSYHGNPTLLKYADKKTGEFNQAEIAKALIHASSAIGADKMLVPNNNWTEEQWNETYQKLGVPKDLADYKIQNNLPEGAKVNENMLKEYTALAHKLGLKPSQAQGLLDFHNTFAGNEMIQQTKSFQDQANQDIETLKTEWGNGFDKNMNLAEQALKHFYPEAESQQAIIDTGFLDTLAGTKFFAQLGKGLGEDQFTPQATGGFGDNIEELDAKISSTHGELYKMGKLHPQYQSKLKEYQGYLNKRHGTASVGTR